jgi:hypothetical protein
MRICLLLPHVFNQPASLRHHTFARLVLPGDDPLTRRRPLRPTAWEAKDTATCGYVVAGMQHNAWGA